MDKACRAVSQKTVLAGKKAETKTKTKTFF
jgi:hypothetical protein